MEKGYSLEWMDLLAVGEAARAGKVGIANEGEFNKTFFSEPLTDYATGWKSDGAKLETLLEFLAPNVRVARRFEYKVANNGDAFAMLADDSDVRALFGEYKFVRSSGNIVQGKTVSKGFTTAIEKDSEMPGDREAKVAMLKRMLIRAEIYRAITLLAAAATNTAKTWGSSATPDTDVLAAIEAYGDAVGIDANRVLFGSTAWQKRISSYQSQAAKGFAPPPTMAGLADFLGVDAIMKSNERYTSGSSKSKLVTANKVFIFQGESNASTEDASTLKRFWTPKAGGAEWATFIDEVTNPELVKITVAHNSQIATTVSTGVQTLTIS